MLKFNEIWAEFSGVVDELNSGMAFFEGYIPAVRLANIEPCLQEFSKPSSVTFSCEPCWSNESDIPATGNDYSISESLNLFREGKLASFDFGYEKNHGRITSNQKLMFMPRNSEAEVTIVCFPDWIVGSGDPKGAVEIAIKEMRCLKKLFGAEELYIGPDGLDLSVGNCLRID